MANSKALFEARQRGEAYADIAAAAGLSPNTVRARVSEYRRAVHSKTIDIAPFYVGTGKREPSPITTERFTNVPVIYGDAIVAADFQLPTTDWHFFDLLPRFAEKHLPKGRRQLALVGDWVNMDAASKYEQVVALPSLEFELAVSEAAFEYLLSVFDVIYYCLGNHEYRYLKQLNGALTATRFGQMLTKYILNERVIMTSQTQLHLVSGGANWRLTHQANYSRNKGIVAAKLADKHQTNLIAHHQHHVAMGRDDWNRFTWIDNGGFHDWEKMAYVSLVDTTSPVMSNSFAFVRDGVGHMLTPYETMTDWNMWGIDASMAIASSLARQSRLQMPDDARQKQPPVSAAA